MKNRNKKYIKRLAVAFLSASFVMAEAAPAVIAAPIEGEDGAAVVIIDSLEDFKVFQSNCLEDSYSMGLTVILETDLDVSGTVLEPISVFCGTFLGNEHTISGLSIDIYDSPAGLFRYVEREAVIDGLTVSGSVIPSGDREEAGGIAGINRGTIRNCTFQGTGEALETLGGIAGVNEESGVIEFCVSDAKLSGNKKIGGIAGENKGSIRYCVNQGSVNTSGKELKKDEDKDTLPSINLPMDDEGRELSMGRSLGGDRDEKKLNMDSDKVRDVGGIAGLSSGIIENCSNEGNIGYQRTGYNIGGIAGRQSGRLFNCNNGGIVTGRKDVGGIAGQLDPFLTIEYEDSALDKVSDIMELIDDTMDSMSNTLDDTGDDTTDRLDQVHAIAEEIQELTRDKAVEQRQDREDFDKKAERQMDIIDELMDDLELDLESDEAVDSERSLRKNVKEARRLLELLEQGGAGNGELIPDEDMPLDGQLEYLNEILSGLTDCAGDIITDADSMIFEGIDGVTEGLDDFKNQLDSLKTAAGDLKDIVEDYKETLVDAIDETGDDISAQMDRLTRELDTLSDQLKADKDRLKADKDKMEKHMDDIHDAVDEGHDRLVDEVDDLTDEDTPLFKDISVQDGEFGSGTIAECQNQGAVQADFQGGGIVGTIGLENGLNPDEDIQFYGEDSVRINRYVRAHISNSRNDGMVTVQNDDAGGIAGVAWFGALNGNENYGDIKTTDGDYCGGIAGESQAFILNSYNKSALTGNCFIGGIVGKGKRLTDNCSMSSILSEKGWKLGNIAGDLYDNAEVSGNMYVKNGFGAVNNATYQTQATGVSYQELLAEKEVPEAFRQMTVTFLAGDEIVKKVTCGYGESITGEQIPEVPGKQDFFGVWEDVPLENITRDFKVQACYQPWLYVVSSSDDPKPALVVEGKFMPGASVIVSSQKEPLDETVKIPFRYQMAGCYSYTVLDPANSALSEEVILHMLAASADTVGFVTPDGLKIISVSRDQEYLVFSAATAGNFVLLKKRSIVPVMLILAASGGIALTIGAQRKKTDRRKENQEEDTE